jgi:chromosome segregation ATPase
MDVSDPAPHDPTADAELRALLTAAHEQLLERDRAIGSLKQTLEHARKELLERDRTIDSFAAQLAEARQEAAREREAHARLAARLVSIETSRGWRAVLFVRRVKRLMVRS